MKAKQILYGASNFDPPCRDNTDKYYSIKHGFKKDFDPHIDIAVTYFQFKDDVKSQSTKTWFDVGMFPIDGRTTKQWILSWQDTLLHFVWYRCIQSHANQEVVWWTSATTSIP